MRPASRTPRLSLHFGEEFSAHISVLVRARSFSNCFNTCPDSLLPANSGVRFHARCKSANSGYCPQIRAVCLRFGLFVAYSRFNAHYSRLQSAESLRLRKFERLHSMPPALLSKTTSHAAGFAKDQAHPLKRSKFAAHPLKSKFKNTLAPIRRKAKSL